MVYIKFEPGLIISRWEVGEMQTMISGVLGNNRAMLAELLPITEKLMSRIEHVLGDP